MAEYKPLPTEEPEGESNPGYNNNDDEDENRRWQGQGAIPKKSGGEEMGMKDRGVFYSHPKDVPGYIKTSTTSKEGEQETSFGVEDLFREKNKKKRRVGKRDTQCLSKH